jgi:hypothetical protein
MRQAEHEAVELPQAAETLPLGSLFAAGRIEEHFSIRAPSSTHHGDRPDSSAMRWARSSSAFQAVGPSPRSRSARARRTARLLNRSIRPSLLHVNGARAQVPLDDATAPVAPLAPRTSYGARVARRGY